MDLRVQYSGVASLYEKIDVISSNHFVEPISRELCTQDHPLLLQYGKSNSCSLSWATATLTAAETALSQRGISVELSLEYILECIPNDMGEVNLCDGISMNDLPHIGR